MHKTAWIFPGQGAQKAGMARDFYERSSCSRRLFDEAEGVLDFDLKTTCFTENEKLNQTEYTQPCLVAACLSIAEELRSRGFLPDRTAGLSLGEYAAISVAGALPASEAIRLVRQRGLLMEHALPAGEGSMMAVLGMETAVVEAVVSGIKDVSVANYNCPGQVVITGRTEGLREAAERLAAAGARRIVPLKVSGPFHSPLLREAGRRLGEELKRVEFRELVTPYYANATAKRVTDKAAIPLLLEKGVSSPVYWQQSIEAMIAEGVDTFIEIGPGRTLAGFLKKINPKVQVYSITSWEDMERLWSLKEKSPS